MSNTQEQSLNEDVAFSPVFESSPEFQHCERERRAVECLLREGPGAFDTKLKQERLGNFLSREEAAQICGWAQDFQVSEEGEQEETATEHHGSTYCPANTDRPPPSLKLGWPERHSWPAAGNTLVFINPPMPGAPTIREVVRGMIRGAQMLVALVTDKLTDSAVIGDLHVAASHGVAVYVVLNKRSVQDGFVSPRLKHQNIQVRLLGGKTFCSQDGKMVMGELRENFLMADLDAVMVGSYSLTWTDAHLHRQLVTVLTGPVVDCFDQEFRVLYAASIPIPETCWANSTLSRMENVLPQLKQTPKPLPSIVLSEDEILPPPTNDPIDWEALGVTRKDQFADDPLNLTGEMMRLSLSRPRLFQRWTTREKEPQARRMEFQQCVPLAQEEHSRNPAWPEGILHKPQSWQKIYETELMKHSLSSNIHKTGANFLEEANHLSYSQQINDVNGRAHFNAKKPSDLGASSKPQVIGPGHSCEKSSQLTKKPLILMVPAPENGGTGDFKDILKGFKTECTSPENSLRSNMIKGKGVNMSKQDPGFQSADRLDKTLPAWRTQASGPAKPLLTPAQTLMKTRIDEVVAGSSRLAQVYATPFRQHAPTFDFTRDWGRPQQN